MHPTRTRLPAFGTGQGWYGQRRRQIAEVRAAATCERALEPYAADLIGEEVEGHSSRLRGRHCGRTAGLPAVRLVRRHAARYQAVLGDDADGAGDSGRRLPPRLCTRVLRVGPDDPFAIHHELFAAVQLGRGGLDSEHLV
jgi:hypothetical protein